MTGFIKGLCAIAIMLGCAFAANAQESTKDTLVVIVKHEYNHNHDTTVHHVVSDAVTKGYKAVENGVVKGYKTVEKAFVDGYQAVEDAFVQPFTDTVSTSINYRRGYRADVEIGCALTDSWGITTSHGFSFGNGLYVGGGVGFCAEFLPDYNATPTYLVPVFADIKYSFINKLASPFVSMKAGGYADVTNTGARIFVNPAIGVDISRFAIKVGYELQQGVWNHGNGICSHHVKCSVAFIF